MEQDFINLINKRDEVAFNKLFEVLYPKLLRFAKDLIKDHQDSEDAVLISFHRMYRCSNVFTCYQELRSFMYVLVKRECINYTKRPQMRTRRHNEITEEVDMPEISNEVELFGYSKVLDQVRALPEHYKKVINLFLLGYRHKEIAQIIGITEDHVKKQKSLAIKIIKQNIGL